MKFESFNYKSAHYRITASDGQNVFEHIKKQRHIIESYIESVPEFLTSLLPLPLDTSSPNIIQVMQLAALSCNVGPMAAVAGALAQSGVEFEKSLLPASSVIVENGGDIYCDCSEDITIGIYCGPHHKLNTLAFLIPKGRMPMSICSSSSLMGHSLSFGKANLFTVMSKDGALADAAATAGCNKIQSENDLAPVCEEIGSIEGIEAVFAVKGEKASLYGNVPEMISHSDSSFYSKISHDQNSDLPHYIKIEKEK